MIRLVGRLLAFVELAIPEVEQGLRDPLLETHIFDFSGDIYGKKLDVQLIAYLRPERRFDSLDLMVEQMHKDAAKARAILATPG